MKRLATAALALSLCAAGAGAETSVQLPDIGDPASAVLTPAQERALGSALLAQIRNQLRLVKDPELTSYVQSLGARLVTNGVSGQTRFSFLLIDDSRINAFAAPGGIVAINAGLLLTAQSESELAAVLAHEIAHVTQRHLARTYAKSGKINVTTALGVLAAVLAGAYGGGDLGRAALYSSLAAGAQAQLAFSRTNEIEADSVGIRLLAAAGYEPRGMPQFLQRLHKNTQLNYGSIPEYLSTHPVTLSRIADTRARAAQFSGKFKSDSLTFRFAKARMRALTSNPASVVTDYERALRTSRLPPVTMRYTYAIAQSLAGYQDKALEVLEELQAQEEGSLPINLALAQAQIKAGRSEQATVLLERMNAIYPGQESIIYHLADALIMRGRAAKALRLLDSKTRNGAHNPELDKLKATAAARTNKPWLSHESTADYYMAYGQYAAALEQFDLAIEGEDVDHVTRARVSSKRKQLKELTEGRR
ncbi:MAG: beta-barrel assembly-enhancing protease [Gammaproteobacteria bacterium]